MFKSDFNKIDIHVHTSYTYGSSLSLKIISKFLQKNPDFGLAITDINCIDGALILKEKYPSRIIVGSQIITKQGAITGLFLKEHIPSDRDLSWTIDAILVQNGLVCLPHPLDRNRPTRLSAANLSLALKRCDLIEIFNSRTINSDDNKAAVRLISSNVLPVCGSDSYTRQELGRTYIKISEKVNLTANDFYDALINAELVCRKASSIAMMQSKLYTNYKRITDK